MGRPARGRRFDPANRVNVYLDAGQRGALRTLSAHTGMSESDLIRKGVVFLLLNQHLFVPPISRETRVPWSDDGVGATA